MGATTTNLGLYQPDISEVGWGALVDNNFTILDRLGQDPNVQWVHPSGSNTNSGLTPATPKKYVLNAYDALPSTGGTIYIADGTNIGGEVAQQGIWLIGPNDPQYASPPSGWRQQKSVSFVGVPSYSGVQFGQPSARIYGGTSNFAYDSTTLPAIWLAGTNLAIRFSNLDAYYVGCGIRLGITADNTSRNNNTSQVWFNNVNMASYNSGVAKSTPQPVVDVGYAFWIWFEHCVFHAYPGYPATTSTLDTSCAMLFKAASASNNSGLIEISDCTLGAGGIQYNVTGATSWGLRVRNVTAENSLQAVVEIKGSTSVPGQVWLERIEQADPPGGGANAVLVADGFPATSVVYADSAGATGPMTILGNNGSAFTTQTTSIAGRRGIGFGPYERIVGKHDASRRTFGLATAVRTNLAFSDLSIAGGFTGTATVTTGQLAPDGTSNAIKLSSASSLDRQPYRANQTFAVGDWVVAGCWVKGNGTATVSTGEVAATVNPTNLVTFADGTHAVELALPWYGDGEWQWLCNAKKVSAIGAQPSDTIFTLRSDSGKDRYYYGPVFLRIPTGTLSDNEVGELLYSLKTWPNTATQGQHAIMPDTSVHIPRGYIEMGEMSAPSAGATNYGRLYMEDTGGGKTRLVVKFPTGAAQVIATEP